VQGSDRGEKALQGLNGRTFKYRAIRAAYVVDKLSYISDRDCSREHLRRDDDRRGSARPTASPKTPEPTEDDRDKRTIFVQHESALVDVVAVVKIAGAGFPTG
jgi:hypothetical protein